jgi:hypothetical protein
MIYDFGFLQSVVTNFFGNLKHKDTCSLLHGRNWMIVLTYPSGKTARFGRGITCMATVLKEMNPELEDANVPAAWKHDALQSAPAATATAATATTTSAPTAAAATPTESVGHKTCVQWQLRKQKKQAQKQQVATTQKLYMIQRQQHDQQVARQVQAQAKKAPAYSPGAVKSDVSYRLLKHMMNGQHVITSCGAPAFGFSSESGAAEALVQIRALQKSMEKPKKRKHQTSSGYDSGKPQ